MMAPPRSALGARCSRPEAVALRAVQACAGRLGAAALSRRTQWPGKAGSTGALAWAAGTLLALASSAALAQMTPVGLWRSMDDKTDTAKAEIRIRKIADGSLLGVVEKALAPSESPNCDLCTHDRKGKPKLGMEIIRGAQKAEGKDVWEEGHILITAKPTGCA
jgi:hypothetical protein